MDSTVGIGVCPNSPTSMEKVHQRATSPGFLVFSRARQILYVNRRALELTGHVGQKEMGRVSFMPCASVSELCAKVQQDLDSRTEVSLREPFEERRVVREHGRKVLLRGFGLPDPNSNDRSRVIIVLEELLDVWQEDVAGQAKEPPSFAIVAEAAA
jgi:PAS domain S-box-containing protein